MSPRFFASAHHSEHPVKRSKLRHARSQSAALAGIVGAVTLGLFLCGSPAAHAQVQCPGIGDQNPGGKWPLGMVITVKFNNMLDPNLEIPIAGHGDKNSRVAAFKQAVDDWNKVLANQVKNPPPVTLKAVADTTNWGADQNQNMQPVCVDSILPPVGGLNWFIYQVIDTHLGDKFNWTSTGNNLNGINNPNGMKLGPGWIWGTQIQQGEDVVPVDVLGFTFPLVDKEVIQEADIAWMTHFYQGQQVCPRVAWDYRDPPAGPDNTFYPPLGYYNGMDAGTTMCNGAANCGYHDFYSVMLHELGHVLGLGHQPANGNNNNVMQATLPAGVRYEVGANGDTEAPCLKELYYPPKGPTPPGIP